MIRKILIGSMLLLLGGAAQAQTPDEVLVQIPDGAGVLQSTALTGSLTSADFSCTWSVDGDSAVFDCDGPFTSTTFQYPRILITWGVTTAPLPLYFSVTSPGAGALSFAGEYFDPSLGWLVSYYEEARVGDWEFGQQFPVCDGIRLEFGLDSPSTGYDLNIAIQWGPDVAGEPDNWSGVKALYR